MAWEKLAGICQKYLHKGSQVFIEGRLRTREYEGRGGEKRKVTELICSNMVMLGGKEDRPAEQGTSAAGVPGSTGDGITDSDIPF